MKYFNYCYSLYPNCVSKSFFPIRTKFYYSSISNHFANRDNKNNNGNHVVGGKLLSCNLLTKLITRDSGRSALFKDLTFDINYGMKIGLLGKNGVGKSTLMKIIGGIDHNFDGTVIKHDEKIKIGYLEQEPKLDNTKTIFENVIGGLQEILDLHKRWENIFIELSTCTNDEEIEKLSSEQLLIQSQLDLLNGWNIDNEVLASLKSLQCPPSHYYIHNCSGGEKRRVALAKLLLSKPNLLLLDEPTNHLDINVVGWLENYLSNFHNYGSFIVVTHDRLFLEACCDYIYELDEGKLFQFKGSYTKWLKKRNDIAFHQDKTLEKNKRSLEREIDSFKNGQRTKNKLNKIELIKEKIANNESIPFVGYKPSLLIPQGPLLIGDAVLDICNLSFKYDDSKNVNDEYIFENLTFSCKPGMVIGIIGPNGIGKTTLIKLITGDLLPTQGKIIKGRNVKLGYIDQSRQNLNGLNMVWEEICDGNDYVEIHEDKVIPSRQYVAQFGFKGESQEKLVSFLSGGERNRCYLAKKLRDGCNVLILDEPSNDLDIDTLRKLEECMETFRGISFVVSHDRYFLDRICTHLISFNGNGQVQWFEGNYSEYLEYKSQYPEHFLTLDHQPNNLINDNNNDNIKMKKNKVSA